MGEASRYRIHGVGLKCQHCGGDVFAHRTAQLNTPALTFLNLDWLNRSSDVYVCERCGFLHWFLDAGHRQVAGAAEEFAPALPPEPIDGDDASSPTTCLACGTTIEPGQDACGKCGWTYRQ
jgi:hypothetical protein